MAENELIDILAPSADAYVENADKSQYQDEEKLDEYYGELIRQKIDEADEAMKTA